jgi:hypothetical protein
MGACCAKQNVNTPADSAEFRKARDATLPASPSKPGKLDHAQLEAALEQVANDRALAPASPGSKPASPLGVLSHPTSPRQFNRITSPRGLQTIDDKKPKSDDQGGWMGMFSAISFG